MDGTIVDGSGSHAFEGDIAVVGNEIVKIGELDGAEATRVIDATGLIVSPGFIDLHNHADKKIRDNPGVENYLYQGVTTLLAGNCGRSPVRLDEYFQFVEKTGIAPNLGPLIGHNAIRGEVMENDNRTPTATGGATSTWISGSACSDSQTTGRENGSLAPLFLAC